MRKSSLNNAKQLGTAILLTFCTIASANTAPAAPWLPARPAPHTRLKCIPQEDLLKAYPEHQQLRISLNSGWKQQAPRFSATPFDVVPAEEPESKLNCSTEGWKSVTLPSSTYKEFPGSNHNNEKPYVRSWYRNEFEISADDYATKTFELNFAVASYHVTVFLNGKLIREHKSEFNPWSIKLPSNVLKPGKNVLAIHHQGDIGKFAGKPIKLTHAYGTQWWRGVLKAGLWGNVTLISEPKSSAKIEVHSALTSKDLKHVTFMHTLKSFAPNVENQKYIISSYVLPSAVNAPKTKLCINEKKIAFSKAQSKFKATIDASKLKRWEIGAPELYDYYVEVWNEDKTQLLDVTTFRFGVRRLEIIDGEFVFNGRKVYMFAQNTASNNWDGIGRDPAEVEKAAEKEILQFLDDGHIIIRTAHEPIKEVYLRVADECGLMIFHEWAWSFSSNLDYEQFSINSRHELKEYIDYSLKHPSVCALSLGNEIHVHKDERIAKLVDENYDLVKKLLGENNMPVSSFSGAARGFSGDFALKTDLLDFHTYTSLSVPVGRLTSELVDIVNENKKKYGNDVAKKKPFVAFELVGFSWGIDVDPVYTPGERSEYERYFKREFTWGAPQIVGFMGSSPLDIINTKGFASWARNYYGRRVYDEFRWNEDMRGFAPWYIDTVKEIELWTQPVYPMLRTGYSIVPRNLFAGDTIELYAAVHNVSNKAYPSAQLKAYIYSDKQLVANVPLTAADIAVPDFGHTKKLATTMTVPANLAGEYRLVIAVEDGAGNELGRNYYDVFVKAKEAAQIKPIRSVYLLDIVPANTELAAAALKKHGVNFKLVKKASEVAANNSVLIVPPDYAAEQVFRGRSKDIVDYLNAGGILLVMEQHNPMTALPGGLSLFKHHSSFVDMAYKGHPVFKGLSWKQFETWNNADGGFVAESYISPFDWKSCIGSKGPMLSSPHAFGSTILEATHGRGRVFINTMQVLRCYQTDSAAAAYWENLLHYILESKSFVSDIGVLAGGATAQKLKPEYARKLDLRPYANAAFDDEVDGDKKGGWTDQGPMNFKNVATGEQIAVGIPFDIIDPATNNGLGCIRLKGSARNYFPDEVPGIKVNQKLGKLYFLHTAAWCFKGAACHYRINYADGTSQVFSCTSGVHIGDWMGKRDLPEAKLGLLTPVGEGLSGCAYVAEWENPNPEKLIKSIDFISAETFRAGKNEWESVEDAIPILLAITGEVPGGSKANHTQNTFPIDKHSFKRFTSQPQQGNGGTVELIPGCVGAKIKYNSHASNINAPFVIMFYNPPKNKPLKELVFKAKSKTDDFIRVEIPNVGWSGVASKEFIISGGGEWQELRLNLKGTKVENGNLLGEIFLSHKSKEIKLATYADAEIEVKDFVFIIDEQEGSSSYAKYEINSKRFQRVSSKINEGNGGSTGRIPESDGVGAFMNFNAYEAKGGVKAPFGIIFYAPPPKGRKNTALVFSAKADKDAAIEINLPNVGWNGQTIREFVISGGNEWQEIRIPLKGSKAENSNLMDQIYFLYKSKSNKSSKYPSLNFTIKNIYFE